MTIAGLFLRSFERIQNESNMNKQILVVLLIMFSSVNGTSQKSSDNNPQNLNHTLQLVNPKERTSGFSLGAGYVFPYTKNSQHGAGIDFFLNYTGNTSGSVALRGGIGLQFASTDDKEDLEKFEGDQILFYAKFGTLVGQVGRNNPVNYYGFGELRAGVGMVDLVSAIAADIDGDEKEPYFDLGFNLGGGVSFQISGNTRFYVEPVVSFATKYNSFVIRGAFEF